MSLAKRSTLLIVEDDQDDAFLLERAFNKLSHNYEIRTVLSGQEAIDYIQGAGKYADRKTHPFPSYIITDLKMGDRDGLHVLEFIKKNPARSIIPVVMLSGSPDPDDVRHAYLLGASSYFVKPSQPEDLHSLVKAIHEYWSRCAVPEVDADGYAIPTDSAGKPGERYSKPTRPA